MTTLLDAPAIDFDADPDAGPDPATDRNATAAPARTDGFDADGFARELDGLRADVLADLGQADADYVHRLIRTQRRLELGGRAALFAGIFPPAWLAGTALLSLAKIVENMEIGHNVMHGQWDWMRDPDVHSTTWEWDNVCPAAQWKHSHNVRHHQWTNIRGMDGDIGYGILRIDPDQPWHPAYLAQPVYFALLALLFEYGVGVHDLSLTSGTKLADIRPQLQQVGAKIRAQVVKDYVAFPALSLPFGLPGVLAAASGALVANVVRNLWSFSVIFCGHFPDGVELFDRDVLEGETKGDWYRRQAEGSANFTGGPLVNLLSGNLDFQIEHHLFPDLPSNRYAEMAPKVRDICRRYGVGYHTGSFATQFGSVVRKVLRLSLPGGRRRA